MSDPDFEKFIAEADYSEFKLRSGFILCEDRGAVGEAYRTPTTERESEIGPNPSIWLVALDDLKLNAAVSIKTGDLVLVDWSEKTAAYLICSATQQDECTDMDSEDCHDIYMIEIKAILCVLSATNIEAEENEDEEIDSEETKEEETEEEEELVW